MTNQQTPQDKQEVEKCEFYYNCNGKCEEQKDKDGLCWVKILQQQFQQAREENERLKEKKSANCPIRFENSKGEFVRCLECIAEIELEKQSLDEQIVQLKKEKTIALDALGKIGNQTFKTADTLCNLKLDSCTNDCKSCFKLIANQALERIGE